MNGQAIFRAICSSFKAGKSPVQCTEGYDMQSAVGHLSDFSAPQSLKQKNRMLKFCVVFIIILNLTAFYLYRRYQRRAMKGQVQSQVQMHVA